MSQLFGRKVALRVGAKVWTGLRVAFEVRRDLNKRPNLASGIRVYGLGAETVGAVLVKGAQLQLSAGYETTIEVLFTGQIERAIYRREGPDRVAEIIAEDGGAAYRSTISRSLGRGVAFSAVVAAVAESMGVQVSPGSPITGTTRGTLIARGNARETLTAALRAAGYEWSIQDGALQVLATGAALPAGAVVLSASTGLVGEPEPLEKGRGWQVRSLLQPKIRPGRAVLLQSTRATGQYRVTTCVHAGDTHAPSPWTTTLELRPA